MRGMKCYSWLFVFALVLMMMASGVQADSKIAFATDRDDADFDIFDMDTDGTDQAAVADETYAERRPSYSLDGDHIIYDDGTDLFRKNADGTGNAVNLTDATSGTCGTGNICQDADADPRTSTSNDNFRIGLPPI